MRKLSVGAAALGFLAAIAVPQGADAAQRASLVGVKADGALEAVHNTGGTGAPIIVRIAATAAHYMGPAISHAAR